MADISSIERRKLERLFRMGGGYVLDFSDRTFSEFFEEHTRRDIDAAIYRERGTSKANRLRGFWGVEGNHLVGKVIQALIQYDQAEDCLGEEPELPDLSDVSGNPMRVVENDQGTKLLLPYESIQCAQRLATRGTGQ